jgi:hypothetical protein
MNYHYCPHCDRYFGDDQLIDLSTGEQGHRCGAIPEPLRLEDSLELAKLEYLYNRSTLEDLPIATPEDLQAPQKAECERIKALARQHPFRLDTKEERLFPGKY